MTKTSKSQNEVHEKKSLRGQTILITRPKESADQFAGKLRALGAEVIELPVIQFAPPENWSDVDRALESLKNSQYDWIIFTSINGVRYFWKRMEELRLPGEIVKNAKLAAIEPATAGALETRGMEVEAVPDVYIAEEIVKRLGDVQDLKILLPRADIARKELAQILAGNGAIVDEVAVYRTMRADVDPEILECIAKHLHNHQIDTITFTSSSTVFNFLGILKETNVELSHVKRTKIACIGPITAKTARKAGLDVHVEAKIYTVDGLTRALVEEVRKGETDLE